MLKKLFFIIALIIVTTISAQTTLIDPTGDGGFETGATFTANGWSVIDQQSPFPFTFFNRWVTNTDPIGYTGARCAYITNDTDGTPIIPPYAYTAGQNSNNPKIHRDITIPAGETGITLSFDWKGVGDSDDLLKVWLVPDGLSIGTGAITPTVPAGTGNVLIGQYNNQTIWTNSTITIPSSYAGSTVQLVFEWNSNDTAGTTPAAIDNISLVSMVSYCESTSNNSSYWIEDFYTNVGGGASDISNLSSGFTATGYQDNTATEIVEQFPGGVIDFIADFSGTSYTYGFNIWVDWNKNGDFNDAGEKVYASGAYVTDVDADFTIPLGTQTGDYRMRIRANYNSTNPDPCDPINNGETEDYTLTVAAISCTDDPSNIVVSAIDITTATINWTAPSSIPGGGYEYYVTTNTNAPNYNQVPTGTTTSAITTANLTGLSENTIYYVWVRSVCGTSFGESGAWIGPEPFTTLVAPPITTNVSICPGDSSQDLTASASCTVFTNIGTTITGNLDIAGPYAQTPPWFIVSTDPCNFDSSADRNKNYATFDFQVDTAGTYSFDSDDANTPFDALGYIVIGPFNYGICPGDPGGSGTWIAGDDDSSNFGLDALITAYLTPGVTYTLVTTIAYDPSQSSTYQWNVSGIGSLLSATTSTMEWYTTASGGSPIGSGSNFDPVGVTGSGLPNTNTTGTYSYWAACPSTPTIRTRADFVIGKVWNGTLGNTDWATATNWIPNGVPDASDCVVISNTGFDPIINGSSDGLGYRLIVENGATLTQLPNSTLTITDAVTVKAGGTYTLDDSASLIQINDVANTVNGTFEIDRTATIRESDYVYWSSPVTTFNVEDISPGTPNGYKYQWLPTVNRGPAPPPGPINYGDWQSANTGVMSPGKGYAIKGPSGQGATPSTFTATFYGTPNNGHITQAISRGTYVAGTYFYTPYAGGDQLTITKDDDNWNFIGNPYPSALHVEEFLVHPPNTNITGAAYIWTHGTAIGIGNSDPFYDDFIYNYNASDYLTVNATGNSVPGPYKGDIGSGQGFFVLMTDASGNTNENVYFENYMRRFDYRNDQFYRSTNAAEENPENTEAKHRIWLDYINPSGSTNTTLIGYVTGATNEKDRMYDAKTIKGEGLNLYSMIDNGSFIIQGRQLPFIETDEVPLGLNITEAGTQTIAINTLEGLFFDTDQNIYIQDLMTGITHNIKNSPYTFTSETGIINDRLVLRYTNNTLNINNFEILNGIKVFENNDKLIVKSEYEAIQSIEVYDLLGRNLFTETSINHNRFTVSDISPNDATLFLKIRLVSGQQKIAKIIF